jgi:hypothetical protein
MLRVLNTGVQPRTNTLLEVLLLPIFALIFAVVRIWMDRVAGSKGRRKQKGQ